MPAAATDLCGRALADKSLATFVGGKAALLLAAATDMAGAAHQTPSPGPSAPNTDHNHGQLASLIGADEAHAPEARCSYSVVIPGKVLARFAGGLSLGQ